MDFGWDRYLLFIASNKRVRLRFTFWILYLSLLQVVFLKFFCYVLVFRKNVDGMFFFSDIMFGFWFVPFRKKTQRHLLKKRATFVKTLQRYHYFSSIVRSSSFILGFLLRKIVTYIPKKNTKLLPSETRYIHTSVKKN